MRFNTGRQPRYPKRRNTSRILFLAVLPVLLLFGLLGLSSLFSSGDAPPSAGNAAGRQQGLAAYGIAELSASEAYPQGALSSSIRFDHLLLEKSKRRLTAFSGGKPVRVYLVALGENPRGHKREEGDKRTPEGVYTISDKNPKSAYHLSLGISYPNEADRARSKKPGGGISLHGLAPEFADIGQAHRLTDWTYGCAAVTNEEIEELYAHTAAGVSIEITP